jgi:hypothetical protein
MLKMLSELKFIIIYYVLYLTLIAKCIEEKQTKPKGPKVTDIVSLLFDFIKLLTLYTQQ